VIKGDTVPATPASEALIGQVLGDRFEVERPLGSGAAGAVYLARQRDLDALRAVKIIDPDLTRDSPAEARFRREAQVLSRLHHDHIVQVIDFGRLPEGGHYLVMEYVEGPSLHEAVEEHGPFPIQDAVATLLQVAEALEYAHGRGVVHRDLKPANILLGDGQPERVKIIDFGLVKLVSEEILTRITADQQILGTPMFMSPEQCRAQETTPAADIYSLGGLGYYLLSSQGPFLEPTVTALLMAHTSRIPERIRLRCPHLDIPSALDDLLLHCLEKSPADRPPAARVAEQLTAVRDRLRRSRTPSRRALTPPSLDETWEGDEAVALEIWPNRSEPGHATETHGDPWMRDAVTNQLSAVLLELARGLQPHLNVSASLDIQVAQIDRIGSSLGELELEIALAAEQKEDTNDFRAMAELDRRLRGLRAQVRVLHRSLNREYVALFRYVRSVRSQVTEPDLLTLFGELEELLEQFRQASVE
jgi:serine/threonine-protein kinase